jgi:hypothetical protein
MPVPDYDIQDFLNKVEAHLQDLDLPVRQAALDEWRSTLHQYLQKMPDTDFLRLKRLLGGPRGVANTIRLQKGVSLKGSNASSTRQAVVWVLGSGALVFVLLLTFLWWKFTPLINISDERVQILGGLIDIDGQLGQVKMGDSFEYTDPQYKNFFEGNYEIPAEVEDMIVEFDRGQIELSYTPDNRLSWSCKVSTEPSDGFIRQEKEAVVVSLKNLGGSDCTFKLPSRLKHTINGDAGKVVVLAPANDTFVQLGSGLVEITPDSEVTYRFDVRVGTGAVDGDFAALSKDQGVEIKVDVGTGRVQKI